VIPARRLAAVLAAVTLLPGVVLLAGCSGSADKPAARPPSPFADCAALTSAPVPAADASAGSVPATAAAAGGAGEPLPDLTLPCFTGDRKVDIGQIRGPALINIWASWCPPCREELPVFQRLTGRLDGSVHVIGVVSQDDRDAAQSLAEDLGVRFPTVYDRQGDLLGRVGKSALPVTVFIGAADRISYVYNSTPLDDASLARLVKQHLGIVVPA
jgi:thiol-disulfide isomerase/thioredoxin